MASSSIGDFSKREKLNRRIARARRALQTQKSHGSFRLRGIDVGDFPVSYR
jgi:hypothetical protein